MTSIYTCAKTPWRASKWASIMAGFHQRRRLPYLTLTRSLSNGSSNTRSRRLVGAMWKNSTTGGTDLSLTTLAKPLVQPDGQTADPFRLPISLSGGRVSELEVFSRRFNETIRSADWPLAIIHIQG